MNNLWIALSLSIGAGLTTVIGAVLAVVFLKKENERILSYILGFTIGIFLLIIFHDLIPESFEMLEKLTGNIGVSIALLLLFLFLGYFATYGLDKVLPEHDHPHHTKGKQKLFKMSLTMVIAMTLHKFPEGMILYMSTGSNFSLAISLAFMIAIHHIPEGISMALTIHQATNSKKEAIKYSLLSGLAVPFGTLFAYVIFNTFMNETLIALIFSLVSGVMLFVLWNEIIPSLKEHDYYKEAFATGTIGIIIMLLIEHFTH